MFFHHFSSLPIQYISVPTRAQNQHRKPFVYKEQVSITVGFSTLPRIMDIRVPRIFHAKQILNRVLSNLGGTDVPKGHFAVYVGESNRKRYVIHHYITLTILHSSAYYTRLKKNLDSTPLWVLSQFHAGKKLLSTSPAI